MKSIFNRAFFGKSNCLKFILNSKQEVYIHLGLNKGDVWNWKKVKFNDDELGGILNFFEQKLESISFFHDFKGDKTQIFINRKNDFVFFRIGEFTKSLSLNEQVVLRELIRHSIVRMNMNL